MSWLSVLPDWLTLLLFIVVPAALAIGVHVSLRRILKPERLIPHHDVAGFLVAIVGVLYAVVLGFVVITVWSNFDAVQRTADVEAGDVGDAYAFSAMLPDPPRRHVRSLLASYAFEVRDDEWPQLRDGHSDARARELLLGAIDVLAEAPAAATPNVAEALRADSTRTSVMNVMRDLADARRLRIVQAQSKMPAALYVALILGALMVLAFVFLFGVENGALQFTMTGIVAGCIGLLLGLIVEFNAPFQGAIRVSPDAWSDLIRINHFQETPGVEAATPPTMR